MFYPLWTTALTTVTQQSNRFWHIFFIDNKCLWFSTAAAVHSASYIGVIFITQILQENELKVILFFFFYLFRSSSFFKLGKHLRRRFYCLDSAKCRRKGWCVLLLVNHHTWGIWYPICIKIHLISLFVDIQVCTFHCFRILVPGGPIIMLVDLKPTSPISNHGLLNDFANDTALTQLKCCHRGCKSS